jgi:hypothetical protein
MKNLAIIIKHVISSASEAEFGFSILAARLQYPSKLHLMKWGTLNL